MIGNKELSCGVIIQNSKMQILGCIPYGFHDNRIDIPKGHLEDGETYIETAIREVYEETGIKLPIESLIDLGMFEYTKYKDLYLFYCKCEIEDVNELTCSTYFETKSGLRPEMIGYEWVEQNNIENKFYKGLIPILNKIKYELCRY